MTLTSDIDNYIIHMYINIKHVQYSTKYINGLHSTKSDKPTNETIDYVTYEWNRYYKTRYLPEHLGRNVSPQLPQSQATFHVSSLGQG